MPIGISLSGVMGSGKTTFAKALEEEFGTQTVSWSQPIKIEYFDALRAGALPPMLKPIAGLNPPKLELDDDKLAWVNAHKDLLRPHLQIYATEFRRAQDPGYWITAGIKRIDQLRAAGANIVVDDTRFPDELTVLRDRGFATVKLTIRPDLQEARLILRDGSFNPRLREHVSESALNRETFRFNLSNNRSERALREYAVDLALRQLKQPRRAIDSAKTDVIDSLVGPTTTMKRRELEDVLADLPISVLAPLQTYGLKIVPLRAGGRAHRFSENVANEVTSGAISLDQNDRECTTAGDRITALYDVQEKTIYLMKLDKHVVFHEIGRAVQHMLNESYEPGKLSIPKSFLDAYEANEAVSPYARRSITTAYAQTFATYFGACNNTYGGDVTSMRQGWEVLQKHAPRSGLHMHETAIFLNRFYAMSLKQTQSTDRDLAKPALVLS
jgi:hypothetical protein